MQLTDKTVVLTGATGGIGQAIAKSLAAAGARLILVGRNAAQLKALKAQLIDNGLEKPHGYIRADLTSRAGLQLFFDCCRKLPAGIDMLINNAGVSEFGLLDQQSPSRIEMLININLTIPMILCRGLVPLLQKKASRKTSAALPPTIVNIGSTFGSIAYPGFCSYSASKFGLRGFSEALRRELADSGIRVIYFAPRATQTSINSDKVVALNQALGNSMDKPEKVALALRKVLLKKSIKEYYLGWPEKLFVRINSLLPSLVDKSLLKQLPVIRRFTTPASTVTHLKIYNSGGLK